MAIGMLVSAAAIVGLTTVTSLFVYTPIFFVCGIGLGLCWALTNVATQAVVPPEMSGAASGIALTSLVFLGAVSVTSGATALDLLSGSATTAASHTAALDTVLPAGGARLSGRGGPAPGRAPPRAAARDRNRLNHP